MEDLTLQQVLHFQANAIAEVGRILDERSVRRLLFVVDRVALLIAI